MKTQWNGKSNNVEINDTFIRCEISSLFIIYCVCVPTTGLAWLLLVLLWMLFSQKKEKILNSMTIKYTKVFVMGKFSWKIFLKEVRNIFFIKIYLVCEVIKIARKMFVINCVLFSKKKNSCMKVILLMTSKQKLTKNSD